MLLFILSLIYVALNAVHLKIEAEEIYLDINKYNYITKDEKELLMNKHKNVENIEEVINKHNISLIIGTIGIIILIIGSFKYYLRQSKEHKKHWSWVTFWLGKNECNKL